MILYMYIAAAGADIPLGQNFDVNRKASSLQPLILYTSFHDLINVYSQTDNPQGQTTPRGRKFDVNRNILSLRSFVTSLKNLFEV